jgi:hypothetical protein
MSGKHISMSTNDLEQSTVSFFREEGLFYLENGGNNSSKIQVPIHQTTWHHIEEYIYLNIHHKNLKSHTTPYSITHGLTINNIT